MQPRHRWIVLRDRRSGERDCFCSDTRASQYALALWGLLVSALLLGGLLGAVQLRGPVTLLAAPDAPLSTQAWGFALMGISASLLHLHCLRRHRGCGWACFLCCVLHSVFWLAAGMFTVMVGVFGFNVAYFGIAALASWSAWCVLRQLELSDCRDDDYGDGAGFEKEESAAL